MTECQRLSATLGTATVRKLCPLEIRSAVNKQKWVGAQRVAGTLTHPLLVGLLDVVPVGLDDNWQSCGSYGPDGFTYHDEGGHPVINTDLFPDMGAMVKIYTQGT